MISDTRGSLTVEALLILPAVILLMALFLRWGLTLRADLRDVADGGRGARREEMAVWEAPSAENIGFLYGGSPARRVRDADMLLDLGLSLKEKLSAWIQE
jgi:hypothetical protein